MSFSIEDQELDFIFLQKHLFESFFSYFSSYFSISEYWLDIVECGVCQVNV